MKYVQVTEIDHSIVPPMPLKDFRPRTDFISRLVKEAEENGEARAEDAEGCPVTATVWEESDSH